MFPQAVEVGEQVDVVADDLLQLRTGLLQLDGPVPIPVLCDGVVVPGVGGDRHPGGVEGPDLVAGEPVRPVEDDRHDEERGRHIEALQDRQRVGVLATEASSKDSITGLSGSAVPNSR